MRLAQNRNDGNRIVRAAFTLMEMLVVVAIIVALAGMGGYYFMNQLKESQRKTARVQVKGTLTTAVQSYMIDHNQMPPPALEVLTVRDEYGFGPYVAPDALIDPWGMPYQYDPSGARNAGQHPDIWSQGGPTGRLIGNWPGGG